MNKRNIVIVIIVIALIVVVAVAASKRTMVSNNQTTIPGTKTTVTGNPKGTSASGTSPTTPSTTLSYKDALAAYQGKSVRVTNDCSPEPLAFTFVMQKGQTIMIANDSTDKTHTVKFDGATYSIAPQHYKAVALPLAGSVSSTCDPKTGTTTVVLKP